MKIIYLTKNKSAIVDDKDFVWLSKHKWFFARTAKRATFINGKKRQVHMHNIIMNPPAGMQVDHINHNKLDNRRCNLRICTPEENQKNKPLQRNNRSGYKGVSLMKSRNLWKVHVGRVFVGYFKNVKEAAQAYNLKAKELFGEFASLNKI